MTRTGLRGAVPEELAAREQGKTCFNFQRPDAALFEKLDALTRRGRAAWESAGSLDSGPIPPERLRAALIKGGADVAEIAKTRKARAGAPRPRSDSARRTRP